MVLGISVSYVLLRKIDVLDFRALWPRKPLGKSCHMVYVCIFNEMYKILNSEA